jgi:hypothetical protein
MVRKRLLCGKTTPTIVTLKTCRVRERLLVSLKYTAQYPMDEDQGAMKEIPH